MSAARRCPPATVARLAALALALAALALTACGRAGRPDTVPGTAAPATGTSPSATPAAGGVGSSSTPTTGPPAPPPSPPASYVDYFRHGMGTLVPSGWTRNAQPEDHTDFRDASGELLLRLGTETTATRADAYLRERAAQAASTYPQYQQIQVGGMNHGQSRYPYSTWEFTFVKDGVTRHVIEAAFAFSDSDPGTFAQVYYSAPSRYFDQTLAAWGHAVQGVYAAG